MNRLRSLLPFVQRQSQQSLFIRPINSFSIIPTRLFTTAKVSDEDVKIIRKQLSVLPKPELERPRKPVGAFNLFVRDNMQNVKNVGAGHSAADASKMRMKALAEKWVNMDQEEKDRYNQESRARQSSYEQDLATYFSNRTPRDAELERIRYHLLTKLGKRAPNPNPVDENGGATSVTNAYAHYVKHLYALEPEKQAELLDDGQGPLQKGGPDVTRSNASRVGAAWKKLTVQEKQPFETAAAAARKTLYKTNNNEEIVKLREHLKEVMKNAERAVKAKLKKEKEKRGGK